MPVVEEKRLTSLSGRFLYLGHEYCMVAMIVLHDDRTLQECEGALHSGRPTRGKVPRNIYVAGSFMGVPSVVFSNATLLLGQQVDSEPSQPTHVAVSLALIANAYKNQRGA